MADMFTLDELAAYLKVTVADDDASALLARELATGLIEDFTHRSFTAEADYTEVLRINAGKITIPSTPVSAVTSVKLVGANGVLTPTVWTFDEIDTIHLAGSAQVLNLPESDDGGVPYTAEVVWTGGFDEVPAAVKAIALAAAGRGYNNPRGLRSETIGQYSYTNAGGDDDVASVSLLAGERLTLGKYARQKTSTLELRS